MTSLISVQGFLFYCNIDILISCRFLKCPFRREPPLLGHFTRTSFIDIHLSHLSMWMKTITVFMCEFGCVGVCAIFMSVCVYVKDVNVFVTAKKQHHQLPFSSIWFSICSKRFFDLFIENLTPFLLQILWHFYHLFVSFLKLLKARNLSHKFVINNLIISLINNTDTI